MDWSGIPEQDRGDSKADQVVLVEQDRGTMHAVGSGGILALCGLFSQIQPMGWGQGQVTPTLTLIPAGITS